MHHIVELSCPLLYGRKEFSSIAQPTLEKNHLETIEKKRAPPNKRQRHLKHLKSEKKHKRAVDHANQEPYDDFAIEDEHWTDRLPLDENLVQGRCEDLIK